jgi:hypothetical protein
MRRSKPQADAQQAGCGAVSDALIVAPAEPASAYHEHNTLDRSHASRMYIKRRNPYIFRVLRQFPRSCRLPTSSTMALNHVPLA